MSPRGEGRGPVNWSGEAVTTVPAGVGCSDAIRDQVTRKGSFGEIEGGSDFDRVRLAMGAAFGTLPA